MFAVVILITLYGVECWKLMKEESRKLLAFWRKFLRRNSGVRWKDGLRNEELRPPTGKVVTVLDRVKYGQRRWYGHVVRLHEERLLNAILHGRATATKQRGRPQDMWLRRFRMGYKSRNLRKQIKTAPNRQRWRHHRHQMRNQIGEF